DRHAGAAHPERAAPAPGGERRARAAVLGGERTARAREREAAGECRHGKAEARGTTDERRVHQRGASSPEPLPMIHRTTATFRSARSREPSSYCTTSSAT